MDSVRLATIETDGWTLESAEARHAERPTTFEIPERAARESLKIGDAAKLLFDVEAREGGKVVDRGVQRMWVIVKRRAGHYYVGVLDSDPGTAHNLTLGPGATVCFGSEHVADIARPPRENTSWKSMVETSLTRDGLHNKPLERPGISRCRR